jgi:tetratricopeptide (TPR) repeat protein
MWAERALALNPNSAIGHAMLAIAIGREAIFSGSQKQLILSAWQIRHHAEQSVLIDNHWVGHYVLGVWHREIASVHPCAKALAHLFLIKLPPASYQESLKHFREVLRQYPDNNFVYAEMAYTYMAMGEMKLACQMFEQCVSMPLFRHPIARHMTQLAIERFGKKQE